MAAAASFYSVTRIGLAFHTALGQAAAAVAIRLHAISDGADPLSMVAGAFARDAGIAAALMATTPVFMLPVSVWFYGARVSALGVVGTLLAGAGVAVCFVSGG